MTLAQIVGSFLSYSGASSVNGTDSVKNEYCSRTLLMQQRERLPASVEDSSVPSVLNFIVDFISGEALDTVSFERERRLAADKGIGRWTPAVRLREKRE